MDRERDRDAVEGLIEEHDEKQGGKEPDRDRPGQGDQTSRSVDSQTPPPDENRSSDQNEASSSDPGPFAPR